MEFLLTSTSSYDKSHYEELGQSYVLNLALARPTASFTMSTRKVDYVHGMLTNKEAFFVEIETVEQLKQLSEICGHQLIVDFDGYDNQPEIEIYNDYRE